MGERRGALGALPARHTLRPPGRAGGVEQQRQILGPGLRRNAARGAGQFLEAAGASFGAANLVPDSSESGFVEILITTLDGHPARVSVCGDVSWTRKMRQVAKVEPCP